MAELKDAFSTGVLKPSFIRRDCLYLKFENTGIMSNFRDIAPTGAVLVTGGAVRIGRAVAEMAADLGAPVVIHCNRSTDDANDVAAQIRQSGGTAAVVAADLTDSRATGALLSEAAKAVGRPIATLINNASIFESDRIESFSVEDFDRNMAVHARAPAQLAQALAAQLPADAAGAIVNLLDQKSYNPDASFFSYTISKFALRGLTEVLARAFAPRIRVNGVALGLTLPPPEMSDARFEELQARTPLGRGASPAEVVAAVRFLLETPSITGETIILDGGEHMGSG